MENDATTLDKDNYFYKQILKSTLEQYLCMFVYDLKAETVFDIRTDMNYKMLENDSSLQQTIYGQIEKFTSLENVPKMKAFTDLSSLQERFESKKVISKIFLGKDHSWCNCKFIRISNETPLRYVLCIIERIDDQILRFEEKKKEQKENKKLHSMMNAFMEEYNTVCNVNLITKRVEFSQLSERLVDSYQAASTAWSADDLAAMYVERAIHENDREEIRKVLTKEYIEDNIEIGNSASFIYRNELGEYFEMRIFRNSEYSIFLGFIDRNLEIEEMHNKIYTDSLTKVKNRKYYDEQVSNQISEAVIICDIDHFKTINDTHGHQFGDVVISIIADTLKRNLRSSDEVIRYGGDEFVITFTSIPIEALQSILENMKSSVEKIVIDNYLDVKLSMSFGAVYGKGITHKMLAKADELLYESKKLRNTITIDTYEKGMSFLKKPNNNYTIKKQD